MLPAATLFVSTSAVGTSSTIVIVTLPLAVWPSASVTTRPTWGRLRLFVPSASACATLSLST